MLQQCDAAVQETAQIISQKTFQENTSKIIKKRLKKDTNQYRIQYELRCCELQKKPEGMIQVSTFTHKLFYTTTSIRHKTKVQMYKLSMDHTHMK